MIDDQPDAGINERSPSPKSVYLLHVMAGSNSTVSMDTAKYLLDSGQCGVNDIEPDDLLTPLHIAASWDNLLMCQLLVHYGADLLAMNRDKCTPCDMAKGKSKDFLRKMMKRGEKRRKRKLFKYLRHLFQSHKSKSKPAEMHRSVSDQYVPSPQRPPTLNQQIDDYLHNADQYNSRLSATRFSGFSTTNGGHLKKMNAVEDKNERTSSISSYKTASERLSRQDSSSPNELSIPSLYPHDQLEINTNPIPSAPPMSPFVTIRRPKADEDTPTALPRTTSLYASLVPRDIPPTPSVSNVPQDEKSAFGDPILNDLIYKASKLSLDQLKKRLKRHVYAPGPLDDSNRKQYERKLAVLELNAMRGVEYEMKRKKMGFKYSIALERLIKAEELSEELLIGLLEEQLIQAEYKNSDKNDISFFCYLLIDISELLPNPSFRDFIQAIFYIGKGKRSRPLHHFADTIKYRQNRVGQPSDKIAHISRIWDDGFGVVSLHLFNNIHSTEALIREGSMIEAMTLENLDNKQRGNFNGIAKSWSRQRQAEFGAFLLKKAYNIYQNERCRPIFEQDIVNMKFY